MKKKGIDECGVTLIKEDQHESSWEIIHLTRNGKEKIQSEVRGQCQETQEKKGGLRQRRNRKNEKAEED